MPATRTVPGSASARRRVSRRERHERAAREHRPPHRYRRGVRGGRFLFRDLLPGGADDLRVGDCFDKPNLSQAVEDVQHHPCTDKHDAEVIFVGEYPARDGAAVPTDEEEGEYISANCLPAFASYTGLDYMSQGVLDIGYFLPLPEGWREGDRTYICWAYRLDNQTMTQSVKTAR